MYYYRAKFEKLNLNDTLSIAITDNNHNTTGLFNLNRDSIKVLREFLDCLESVNNTMDSFKQGKKESEQNTNEPI